MRVLLTPRRVFGFLLVTIIFDPSSAGAQNLPPIFPDHYEVRALASPINANPPIQVVLTAPVLPVGGPFGSETVTATQMGYVATPVSKNGSEVVDSMGFYTWWRITGTLPPDPYNVVFLSNQFGGAVVGILNSRYLLNPALMNGAGNLPPRNHYRCYDCVGGSPDIAVTLTDKFCTSQHHVRQISLFCRPVEKTDATGTYPIVDPDTYLLCYPLEATTGGCVGGVNQIVDQFGAFQADIGEGRYLCVPSNIVITTPTNPATWGRVKSMYR